MVLPAELCSFVFLLKEFHWDFVNITELYKLGGDLLTSFQIKTFYFLFKFSCKYSTEVSVLCLVAQLCMNDSLGPPGL